MSSLIPAPGHMGVDYEERVDFDRLRRYRLERAKAALAAQIVQQSVASGRVTEDFAILLDQQAAASGLELKPEDTPVDDGLTPKD